MKVGVNLKLDVTKIDKDKIYVGAKGKYLDATVFIDIDQKDQYENNGMITQSVPKDSQEKGNILGNCKVFWSDRGNQKDSSPQAATQSDNFDDDIPF